VERGPLTAQSLVSPQSRKVRELMTLYRRWAQKKTREGRGEGGQRWYPRRAIAAHAPLAHAP
jgi:hypothetical protein